MIKDIFDTYREAFRQWVRSKTRPKSLIEAEEKRLFWSKCYLVSISCAVGIYLYQLYQENSNSRKDRATSMALLLAKGLNETESIKVLKYKGLTQVSSVTINPKDVQKGNELKEKLPMPEVT